MFKYVTINGDIYIRTERVTARRLVERVVTKCRQFYISTFHLFRIGGL
jgi:hypothetical protein